MSRVLNYSFVSAIALAAGTLAMPAQAQVAVGTIPLNDFCALTSPTNITQCIQNVIGTRNITVGSSTTIGTNTVATGNIDFDGLLQITGLRMHGLPLDASVFYSPDDFANITVDLAANYDFLVDFDELPSGIQYNPATSFTFNSATVRAINFSQVGAGYANADGSFGTYSLAAIDPTAIVMNGTALAGTFRSAFDSPGPIQFGRLTGRATLLTGTIVTDPSGGGLTYVSPYGLDVQVTQTVTTQIDENGILTEQLTVSSGIINTGDQVIIGNGSSSGGGKTVSIGVGNIATGDGAVAIGDPNIATGLGAVAIGADNTANGQGAVAIGNANIANGFGAVALGDSANASNNGAIAIGAAAQGTGVSATAVGNGARAPGELAAAFGRGATANGATSVAVGNVAFAGDEDSVAIGDLANASGFHATAVGGESVASGRGAQTFGWQARATGLLSGAFGHQAMATGDRSTALGKSAVASALESTAVGNLAVASDEDAVAVGDKALATGFHSTSVGGESVASGRGAQAFGWQSAATGNLSLAAGHQARATALNSTAVGKNANAGFDNSTAVGFAATTTRANQIMLGSTGSSVTVGDIAASTAAQTGPLSFATVDASGTIGRGALISSIASAADIAAINTQIAAINTTNTTQNGQIAALQSQTASLFNLSEVNRRGIRKANEGVAMALAMESPALPSDAKFAISGGIGYYEKRTAATTAFTARVGDKAAISAGVGVGLNTGEVGARGGFQVAW